MPQNKKIPKGDTKRQKTEEENHEGKISPLMEQETLVTYVSVPPDGGWGWVVVAASFCCNFFSDGMINTSGLYIGRIDAELEGSKANVSLIGSILVGFSMIIGPLVSALVNRFGFRLVCMLGAVMSSTGFAISSLATSVEILWLTYGILGGFGFGMMYVPAVVVVGFYFERWRSTATCLAMVGSGFGTIMLAPITSYLLDNFGWRGTMLAQSGMILSCAVFGILFRPLSPVQITIPCKDDYGSDDEATTDENRKSVNFNNMSVLMTVQQQVSEMKESDSKHSILSGISLTSSPPREINSILKAGHNAKYATVNDVLSDKRCNIKTFFDKPDNSINQSSETVVKKKARFDITALKNVTRNEQTEPKNDENKALKEPNNSVCDSTESYFNVKTSNNRRNSIQKLAPASSIFENHRNSICLKHNLQGRRYSESVPKMLQNRRATISAGVRPIYRDDIFLQFNPSRLPQYSSRGSGLEYTMQVTRLPTFNDVLEEQSSKCYLCPEAVRRTLATMLDFHLLSSPSFLIFCVSGFITNMGFYVPFMFIESRVKDAGLGPDLGTWLISIIGVSNTLGRVFCGAVTSSPRVSALMVNNALLTAGGVATMLSGLYMTANYQIFFAATFGFTISVFSALRSTLTADLIGLENLTNGFGLMLLFQGVSAAIGSPLAGFIMDQTEDYDITFVVAGSFIVLSAVMCIPLARIKRRETERRARITALRGPTA